MTEFRPGGFQVLPLIVKNLLIINVLVFVAQLVLGKSGGFPIEDYFALHDVRSSLFRPHQLITYMFLHGDEFHIFSNMFALWMFGSALENYWGPKRFLLFYMVCGIGAGLLHLGVLYYENGIIIEKINAIMPHLDGAAQKDQLREFNKFLDSATLGASGSVFGCLAAFGYLFPNSLIYLYFFVPIKAKWFVIGYAAMELFAGVRNSAGDNVAHWAHLGGALVGIVLVFYWNKTNRKTFY